MYEMGLLNSSETMNNVALIRAPAGREEQYLTL